MNERLQKIKKGLESKVQSDWLTWDDIEWLIQTVEDQQEELEGWRKEFMF
jgi:hypothetical protein